MSAPADLTAALVARGDLVPGSEIAAALNRVPRERFTPDVYWIDGRGDSYVPRFRSNDPALWAEPIYRNEPIVTQVDGGRVAEFGAVGRVSTCSLSAPGIVALMLRQAAIMPGDRVLEIGTGQGFNTALCAELSGREVVSVEFDATLADLARRNLVGYPASVLVGDGKAGCAELGQFDAILSTVAFARVPEAWLSQLAPGGRIVVPLHPAFYRWGVATLVGDGAGGAAGGFLHDGNFMSDRSEVSAAGRPPFHDEGRMTQTSLSPRAVLDDNNAKFALGYALPGVRKWQGLYEGAPEKSEWYSLWLWDEAGSWAAADFRPDASVFEVEQFGPRSLWDELERAYTAWVELGHPRVEQWRYVVTAERQCLDFDGIEQNAASALG